MGVFSKLSGLLGGKKAAGTTGARPVPVGSPGPVSTGTPRVGGPQAKAPGVRPEFNKQGPVTAAAKPSEGAATQASANGPWSGGGVATLEAEPPRSDAAPQARVAVDISDDRSERQDHDRVTSPMSSVSQEDASAMLSDVPPPPPAYTSTTTISTVGDESLEPVRTPRNRQELIEELQKNYSEVVKLVRKVDGHLDDQDKRSERLLTIAESLPGAIEDISQIREQHVKLTSAIDALTAATKQSASTNEAAQNLQIKALGEVRSLMETSENHERRVADTLEEFKTSIGDVATSTGQLGGVMQSIEARQERRENELRQAIESGQKWMVTAVVMGLVCLAIVVVVGVIAWSA